MIYETKSPRYSARAMDGRFVAFQAAMTTQDGGDPFGVFDTSAHPELGTEAEAIAFIESLEAFKTRKPGLEGIWRRSEREEAERGLAREAGRKNTVNDMTETTLRGIAAANNVAVPVSATLDDLRRIVLDILSGRVPSGSTAIAAPAVEPKPKARKQPSS